MNLKQDPKVQDECFNTRISDMLECLYLSHTESVSLGKVHLP